MSGSRISIRSAWIRREQAAHLRALEQPMQPSTRYTDGTTAGAMRAAFSNHNAAATTAADPRSLPPEGLPLFSTETCTDE